MRWAFACVLAACGFSPAQLGSGGSDDDGGPHDAALDGVTPAWMYKRPLTIDNTGLGALTGFPLAVVLDPTHIRYSAAGADLRFTDNAGTPLAYEIEHWNASGRSYVWVGVPVIAAATTTTVWMYYGNPNASDGQMPAAVWDADFVGVWHLVDGHDSTGHNASSNNGGTTIPGQLGPALHFDGAAHYVDTASTAVLAQWTIEAWANPTNPATYNSNNASAIIGQFPNYLMLWDCYTNGFCHTVLYNDAVGGPTHYASYNLSTGTFTHVAGRFDGANVETYVAGARVGQTASTAAPAASASTAKIGARESGPYYFIGAIDEVRISRIGRSPDYLAATVRAGNGSYVTIGDEVPN